MPLDSASIQEIWKRVQFVIWEVREYMHFISLKIGLEISVLYNIVVLYKPIPSKIASWYLFFEKFEDNIFLQDCFSDRFWYIIFRYDYFE